MWLLSNRLLSIVVLCIVYCVVIFLFKFTRNEEYLFPFLRTTSDEKLDGVKALERSYEYYCKMLSICYLCKSFILGHKGSPKRDLFPQICMFPIYLKTYKMLYEWVKLAFYAIFAKVHQRHFNHG